MASKEQTEHLLSPPSLKSQYQRPPLGPARTFQKEWKIHDFVGKYHLTRVKNLAPVPGTALALEKSEKEAKAADAKRFEDQLHQRAVHYKKTIRARGVGAEEATKLHVDAIIGSQIDRTENALHARAAETNKKNYFSDTLDQIMRFKKNVLMDRPHYIGYAVVFAGFRSLAWQDEETGDSFVHMAVKRGFIDMLGELLKYNADANLVNKMGNAPIHEAWYQWVPPPNTAEVRCVQEARTCAILRHLCSWSACPDNLHKTDGCTALHWAARLGPVKAVVILLGFNADHTIRNKNGETPLDLAVSHKQTDIIKVLSNWSVMKRQSQHEDFAILWKRFIADHEIPMSNEPDAKTIIYKLHMRDSVNKMNRVSGDDYMIDDPLIQRARIEGILADQELPLKPWDKKYQAARARKVSAVAIPKGQYFGETPLERSRPGTALGKEEVNNVVPSAASGSHEIVFDSNDKRKSVRDLSSARMKRRNITNLYAYLINENRPKSALDTQVPPIEGPIVDDGLDLDSTNGLPRADFEDDDDNRRPLQTPTIRANSAMKARRLSSAQRIVRDAKFELCTFRPCTSSSLLLSRRTKAAPLFGTEEQKSINRFLSSKFEDRPKSPPKADDLTGDLRERKIKETFNRPSVTPMGAYKPVDIDEVFSENENLYKRLQNKDFDAAKRQAELTMNSLNDVMNGGAISGAGIRGTMVPMVHARARSIEDRMVPPRKILSHTDKLNLAANAAVAKFESEGIEQGEVANKKNKGQNVSKSSSPPIKYGANRLRSAEMTTMPIQNPWSTVNATFNIEFPV